MADKKTLTFSIEARAFAGSPACGGRRPGSWSLASALNERAVGEREAERQWRAGGSGRGLD